MEGTIIDLLQSQNIAYEYVYFNPGVHDKSFKIKTWDLKKMCRPRMI